MQVLAGSPRYIDPLRAQAPPSGLPPAPTESLASFSAAVMTAISGGKCLVPLPLDLPDDMEAQLAATLGEAERRHVARFRRPRDRRHYIVAHGRLRELLAERLDIRPEAVALDWDSHGKPRLSGAQADSGWHFNLSYSDGESGGLALCALSHGRRIGVDVERVRPLDHAESVARHFFSPREYESYRRLAPAHRPLAFFLCWTRKEALIKATGMGLSQDLADFDVTLAPGQPARLLRLGGLPGERCGWHLESIGPVGGRVAALVIEQEMD